MANVNIKRDMKLPILVIAGDYGTGKSHINKVLSKYINSVASINRLDFLTRKLLFICGIHPLEINYVLLSSDKLDRELFVNNTKLMYLKTKIEKHGLKKEDIEYLILNVIKVNKNKINWFDDVVNKIYTDLKFISEHKNKLKLKTKLYEVTEYMFKNVILAHFKWNNQEQVDKYLMSRMNEYKPILDRFKGRIVYYAYTPEEIVFFKEKFSATTLFVEMSSNLQSQLLVKNERYDKVDEISRSNRKEDLKLMKQLSDISIKNDLELDSKIKTKILPTLDM